MRKLRTLLFLGLLWTPAWATATPYANFGTITIDHTKVSGSANLANFTVGIELSDASFKLYSADPTNGKIRNTATVNGQTVPTDLIFTTDSSGLSPMNWEIESYDGTNGVVWAWVKITSLSHAADTVLYVFYGNSSVATFQGGAQGAAWDAYTAGVWHFGTPLNLTDSSANNNAMMNHSVTAQASAQIGGGATFVSSHYLSGPSGGSLNITGRPITISAWIKQSTTSVYEHILAKGIWSSNNYQYGLRLSSTNTIVLLTSDGSGGVSVEGSTGTITTGQWTHVAGSQDATNMYLYINGALDRSVTDGKTITSQTCVLVIGATSDDSWAFPGDLDEIRVASTTRSGDWLKTEYNNGSAMTTFSAVSGLGACSGVCGAGGAASAAVTLTPIIV
ncbi:MAG: LamG-like jellyroll fold domain-containing protein [Bryobacteraceae bacterium]